MRLPIAPMAFLGLAAVLSSCSSFTSLSSSPELLSKKKSEAVAKKTTPSKKVASTSSSSSYNSFYPSSVSAGLKEASATLPKDKHGSPTYSDFSKRNRVVRTTAYSHMENEPGAPGRLNAVGTTLKYGPVRSAAADWSRYPVGTKFKIKGLPHTYVVDDYGSALVGTNTIDIFHPSLSLMNKWGTRPAEINVIQWGSWERTVKILKGRTKYSHCRRMYNVAVQHLPKAPAAAVAQND